MYLMHDKRVAKPHTFSFMCSKNRKHIGEDVCTPHTIREAVLDEIILEEIRRVTYCARAKTEEFARQISQKTTAQSRRAIKAKQMELEKLQKRDNELNTIFKRVYEDKILGRISDEQFKLLSEGYISEQGSTKEKINALRNEI